MTALELLIGVLATYRVARMIALEDGPFDALSTLRAQVGQKTWVGRGLHCVLCLSFWLAWPAAALLAAPSAGDYALAALAIGGGAVVVHKVIG